MKTLELEQLEQIEGGINQEAACGFAIGFAVFATGGWFLLAGAVAMSVCLTADTY